MKQNSIVSLNKLKTENYENIFNVYREENGLYYYNLIQTVVFPSNLPKGLFSVYEIGHGDSWPYISYKVYNTPNLWWIILLANQIDNPTNNPVPGSLLKIPKTDIVKEVLAQIKKG
jgi:hypothetical protein